MQPLIECQKSEVRSQATEGGETLRQPSPTRRGSPQPQGDRIITRSRNTSPNEELQLRLARVAPLIKISDHEVAALLHETRLELVEPDGAIRFELAGLKREYYHPESPTCQNLRGQKVLVTISRTFTDAIFVIQPDHKYLDTIPLKNTLPWFDHTRLGAEIREQETVLKRSAKELEQLHGGEIERQAYAGRGNVAKVAGWRAARILHSFPSEETSNSASAEPAPAQRGQLDAAGARSTGVELVRPTFNDASPAPEPPVDNRPFGSDALDNLTGPAVNSRRSGNRPCGPEQTLSEQLATERTRCQARVHRAAAGRQRARVDYADALDDLAVSITAFNQPTERE